MKINDEHFWIILEDEDEEDETVQKHQNEQKPKFDPIEAGFKLVIYAALSVLFGLLCLIIPVLILKHFFGWWT